MMFGNNIKTCSICRAKTCRLWDNMCVNCFYGGKS